MTGAAGCAMHFRLAAEVLLRTHEELSTAGEIEPLPDFSGSNAWHPLLDRLRPPSDEKPLDSILSDFGLVPHPRLLLLVEGATELVQLPRLIASFADPRPEFIRVHDLGGVETNPGLLARYVVTPRIGKRLGNAWMLHSPPTALMIAVDQEGSWAREGRMQEKERRIRDGIRREVARQGGHIDDETLDFLVHVRTWGPGGCYELANFDDDELLEALTEYAPDGAGRTLPSRDEVADLLSQTRRGEIKFGAIVGRCRTTKPELAERLWPTLLAKAEQEIADGNLVTPVVQVLTAAVGVAHTVHPQVRGLPDRRPSPEADGPSS
jgi:hypothetical protein